MIISEAVSALLVLALLTAYGTFTEAAARQDKVGRVTMKNQGDSLTITCDTNLEAPLGAYLHVRHKVKEKVLYFDLKGGIATTLSARKGDVQVERHENVLTIHLFNLTMKDTGVYWCVYSELKDDVSKDEEGDGAVFLVVNVSDLCAERGPLLGKTVKEDSPDVHFYPLLVASLSGAVVVLLCAVLICKWLIPKIRNLSAKERDPRRNHNDSVYEDMCRNHPRSARTAFT